ncbi:MAG: DUF4159 domain-containing protein, partial [Gemmataceae bacterium]
MKWLLTLCSLGLFASAQHLPAQASDVSPKAVNEAIQKGRRFLLQQQNPQGTWEGIFIETLADMEGGRTALATLALLTSGMSVDDPALAKSLQFLRDLPPKKTYVVALTTMALAEARQPRDLDRIQKNVDWLLSTAIYKNGRLMGWMYPTGPTSVPDASNTQYALLGLYAGKMAGAKIPDSVWLEIREHYIRSQHGTPADIASPWSYLSGVANAGSFGKPSFTMTTAGICGLLISSMGLATNDQEVNETTGV